MTKKDLVAKIAEKSGVTKKDIDAVLKALPEVVGETLAAGRDNETPETISIPGFGVFSTSFAQGRQGIDPRTKQPMEIPSAYRMRFRASKALKDAINA